MAGSQLQLISPVFRSLGPSLKLASPEARGSSPVETPLVHWDSRSETSLETGAAAETSLETSATSETCLEARIH